MRLVLNAPFSRNSAAAPGDTLTLKRALGRLGFYRPSGDHGLTDIPDRETVAALTRFQRSQGLPATGVAKPGDATIQALEQGIEVTERVGWYRWRTRRDDRVRPEHQAREGESFQWAEPPEDGHPGEPEGCRCWAEASDVCFTGDFKDELKRLIADHEDFVRWPYLDTKGLITIGYGFNVDALQDFLALDLTVDDEEGPRPATLEEKQTAHQKLQEALQLLTAEGDPIADRRARGETIVNQGAGSYESTTNVRMEDSVGDRMLDERVDQAEQEIIEKFDDFPCYPTPAKIALTDMIYNIGPHGSPKGDGRDCSRRFAPAVGIKPPMNPIAGMSPPPVMQQPTACSKRLRRRSEWRVALVNKAAP